MVQLLLIRTTLTRGHWTPAWKPCLPYPRWQYSPFGPSEDTYGFYDDYSAYANDATSLLKLASRESQNTDANAIQLKDGTMMKRAGKSGTVKNQEIGCTVSGFLIRK